MRCVSASRGLSMSSMLLLAVRASLLEPWASPMVPILWESRLRCRSTLTCPNMNFNTFSFGAAGAPLGITENTYQVIDNFSKIIHTHTITFGGQFRYNQLVEYNLGSNGSFNFDGSETGVDFADFLIGAPTAYSQGQGYPSYGRSRYIGLFAQDSWRAHAEFDV